MNTITKLKASRPWIAHVDDERSEGNSIIVTLSRNWFFVDEKNCGVRGFDTMQEVKEGTKKTCVFELM